MMGSKRILHCIPSMGGGGAERQLAYLCRGLAERGWEAHVALLREGPNSRLLRESGAVVHPIRYWSHYDPTNILRVCHLIRAIKPGLVQTWIPMMDMIGGAACKLSGVPHVISERNSALAYPSTYKNKWRLLIANEAACVISNSSGGDTYWRTKHKNHLPHNVISNALLLEKMQLVAPMHRELIGADSDQKVILFAGRFEKQKNMKNLLLAFRRVMQRPKVVAYLCGEGPLLSEVEVEIRNIGLVDRIFIPGYVTDIWAWMKTADIFVSVSLFEGMPNTVMEAMACGCPIVVSDIPQHREILDEGEATFVDPGDPDSIASGIERMLGDTEEAGRKAACAKVRASRWSIQAMAECYERVYLEILGAAK